jgi:hypothetical protein
MQSWATRGKEIKRHFRANHHGRKLQAPFASGDTGDERRLRSIDQIVFVEVQGLLANSITEVVYELGHDFRTMETNEGKN